MSRTASRHVDILRCGFLWKINLSSTPRIFQGNHQTTGGAPVPREFHPRQVLCRLLSLRGAVTEQEYHYPHRLSSPLQEPPGAYGKLFVAPCKRDPERPKKCVGSQCLAFAHPGAAANVAYAHRNSNGKVFDEWYSDFKVPSHSPLQKRKTGEGFLLHPFPNYSAFFQPSDKIFFNLFSAEDMDLATA